MGFFPYATDHALPASTSKGIGQHALSLYQFPRTGYMITRRCLHHEHDIQGNGCSDSLMPVDYGCCALVHEDNEMEAQRQDEKLVAPG